MKYVLGYPNAKIYHGSWAEWGSIVGFPVENKRNTRPRFAARRILLSPGGHRRTKDPESGMYARAVSGLSSRECFPPIRRNTFSPALVMLPSQVEELKALGMQPAVSLPDLTRLLPDRT